MRGLDSGRYTTRGDNTVPDPRHPVRQPVPQHAGAQRFADPHAVGWFWRLFGLYGRHTHPVTVTHKGDETGALTADMQEWFLKHLQIARDRKERYRIFDEMDTFGLVSSILDVYAEEATQKDYDRGRAVWVESKSQAMIRAGDECLRNAQVEDRISFIARRACKRGDAFQRTIYETGKGILGWKLANAEKVHRLEDKYGRLIGFREDGQKYRQKTRTVSWPWDYVHFRLLGKYEEAGYGTAILDGMFRPWRQLCLASSTLIWTDTGPVRADEIKVGAVVYCHDPEIQKTHEADLTAVIDMGVQKLVRIRTAHRQITVTENHGMLVRQADGSFIYKRAKDLIANGGVGRENWEGYKNADALVLPRLTFGACTHEIEVPSEGYYVTLSQPIEPGEGCMQKIRDCDLATSAKNTHAFLRGGRSIRYSDFCKLSRVFDLPSVSVRYRSGSCEVPFGTDFKYTADRRFARFFGFMLGDGWVCKNHVGFALGVYEKWNQYYCDLYESLFGSPPNKGNDAIPGERGASMRGSGRPVADLFRAAGFITGFATKVVPGWVFRMSDDFKRELLYGLFDADGGEQGNGWRLSLANETLMRQVWTLLQQSGFKVSRELAEITRAGRQPAWRLYASMCPTDNPVVYEPVTHVDPAGEDRTYDLTVSDELHNFVADGVVSHNTLAEDSVLMYRMRRAPDRNLVLVDVGNMEEHEAVQYLNAWRKKFRKFEFIDPASPNYKKQYNPLTPLEDIFLAMRRDNQTRIESLSGAGNMGELYDLDHFRDKFFGSAKVPKAYFGFEGEINAKATLMQQDVRFARTLKRVQQSLMYGLRQLLEIHYTLLASTADDHTYDFSTPDKAFLVQMSPVSYLDEWERLQLIELRYRIVESMSRLATDMQLDPRVWAIYILLNYAKLPEELVLKLISKTPDEPLTTAGGGGGFGGMESLPTRLRGVLQVMEPDQRTVILESMTPVGIYPMSGKEKVEIAKAMHASPELRKVVGDLAYYHEDEGEGDQRVLRASLQQVDLSILPPTTNGQVLVDDYDDDPEAKQLAEDVKVIAAGEKLKTLPGKKKETTT